jgi:hypothetical protein
MSISMARGADTSEMYSTVARARAQPGERPDDQREALGQVIAGGGRALGLGV